jgi:hypothetical protein
VLAPNSPPSFARRARLILFFGVVSALIVWLTIGVLHSIQHENAAAELRQMGFEAGSPSIFTLGLAKWREIFNPKRREWNQMVRLMGSNAKSLDRFASALHRFKPRKVLLGFCRNLEDVSALRALPELERLDFYECPAMSNPGIVSEFPKLKELTFRGNPFLRSLDVIKAGKNLTKLHITNCAALDDLKALSGMPSLDSLYLTGCPAVKDAELLRGLTALVELNLSDCRELNNVDGLHGLKMLKSVNLLGCSKLTTEAVASLRAAIPNAKIYFR